MSKIKAFNQLVEIGELLTKGKKFTYHGGKFIFCNKKKYYKDHYLQVLWIINQNKAKVSSESAEEKV